MVRLAAISEPQRSAPGYSEGFRAAVSAALEYLLVAVERPQRSSLQPPTAVLRQAETAARTGATLETVLRRCFAGYTLFGDFLIEEAEDGGLLQSGAMKQVLRDQASSFDRLVAAVTLEYTREAGRCSESVRERRAKLVEQLLAGEPGNPAELAYDFDAQHLGLLAKGIGAGQAVCDIAKSLDRRLLAVERLEGVVWAWLGSRRDISPAELQRLLSSDWPSGITVAIGEPTEGLSGWRLTHQQALAALPIAASSPHASVYYGDVALLASAIQDDLLAASLRTRYLAPLVAGRDGGAALRETLRAYLAADRNISSAAAMLGVNRRTVANRIRAIEERLNCPLRVCAAEIEVALRLAEHEAMRPPPGEALRAADDGAVLPLDR
jgi:hypothetical protein